MTSGELPPSSGSAASIAPALGFPKALPVPGIRLAGADDLPVLVDFRLRFLRAVKEIRAGDEPALRSELADRLSRGMSTGKTPYWIAESGGIIVASCALLFPRGRGNRAAGKGRIWLARRAELMGVFTLPAFRRRGAASALVRHVISQARGFGLRQLFLQPTEEAREMYLKIGFADDGDRMSMDLDAALDLATQSAHEPSVDA